MGRRTQKMYLAQKLVKRLESTEGWPMQIENPSQGLVGALLVFSTKTAARAVYGRGVVLREIKLDTPAV